MTGRRTTWTRMLAVAAMLAAALATGVARPAAAPAIGQPAPEIVAGKWINSAPLTIEGLRGRVVAVEFWTFG
jgi:hypothetical protein